MGTLAALIPLLGLIAGQVISWFTKQEIKYAKQLLTFLFHFLVFTAIAFDTYTRRTWTLYALLLVFAAFVIYSTATKQDTARWTTLFLGLRAPIDTTLASISLIALLTLGSLHKPKELLLPCALYIGAVTIQLLAQP